METIRSAGIRVARLQDQGSTGEVSVLHLASTTVIEIDMKRDSDTAVCNMGEWRDV